MKVYRTLLFIPGNKPKWMSNIDLLSADAVILDLEDSVPAEEKEEARKNVASIIDQFARSVKPDLFVRINRNDNIFDEKDIETVIRFGIDGIVLPKVYNTEEINQLSKKITKLEKENEIEEGYIKLLPILETAESMYFCYDIAKSERVIGITGLSSKNGDVERALGTKWTFKGMETLYMKSKVVMAARAAGISPIGGLWQDVHDLKRLKISAEKNHQLGFDGELVLHPSNIEVINRVYSPSEEDIAYYKGLITTFNEAKEKGDAAVIYKGSHIDYAHVKTAEDILKTAENNNKF